MLSAEKREKTERQMEEGKRMIDGKKTVYVVSVHTRGEKETIITVFDNEDAALKYAASVHEKKLFDGNGYLVQIDEAPVYTKFMEADDE